MRSFKGLDLIKTTSDLDKRIHTGYIVYITQKLRNEKIDKDIAKSSSFHALSEDFTSQFDSIDDFIDRGVGYAILNKGQVVSAATSFSIFDDGIEIEIASHPEHRRKGLAMIVASALILDCLDRGKYPSWDGANSESVELAKS